MRATLAGLLCLLLAACTGGGGGEPGKPAHPAAPSLKLTVVSMPLNCQPVPDVPDGCQVGGSGLADGLGKVRVYSSVRLGLPRPGGCREATTTGSLSGAAWSVRFAGGGEWCGQRARFTYRLGRPSGNQGRLEYVHEPPAPATATFTGALPAPPAAKAARGPARRGDSQGGGRRPPGRPGRSGELVVPADGAVAVWDALLAAGGRHDIRPCGLGARDTLRTEMGYPLHGQDISLDITPVQARLGWAVGWSKPSFWGRAALLAERERGPSRVLRGIVAAGRGIARPGMRVVADSADGDPVGVVTSGTFSPTLRKGVGLALVDPGLGVGESVGVEVRQRREAFVVTKPPFVTPSVR